MRKLYNEHVMKKIGVIKFKVDLSNKNVIHVKHEKMEYLQFRKLLEYSDILVHAYSLGVDKSFRTSIANKEEYDETIRNYNKLCDALNLDSNNLVKMDQKHTNEVKIANRKIPQSLYRQH